MFDGLMALLFGRRVFRSAADANKEMQERQERAFRCRRADAVPGMRRKGWEIVPGYYGVDHRAP